MNIFPQCIVICVFVVSIICKSFLKYYLYHLPSKQTFHSRCYDLILLQISSILAQMHICCRHSKLNYSTIMPLFTQNETFIVIPSALPCRNLKMYCIDSLNCTKMHTHRRNVFAEGATPVAKLRSMPYE